ncbi:DUF190 domain-containing protein [bacterium]|nr:MAG: DUF190 domain-containing protein [bacterium]
MKIDGEGKLLRIFVGESDKFHSKPLFEAIVEKAKEIGMAGSTVLRGIEGFGANSRIHTAKILRLSEDLPMLIEIVDSDERIKEALPVFENMINESNCGVLVTLERVEIIKYTSRSSV